LLAVSSFSPSQAWAQKIIHIKHGAVSVIVNPVRVHKFGRVTRGRFLHKGRFSKRHVRHVSLLHKRVFSKKHIRHVRFSAFALPDQTLFPPYYAWPQPYARGPDMTSRIKGGKTVLQGSIWRSRMRGGKTVRQGSIWRSHIKGGRTVEGGSRWASQIVAGRTVEGGSKWRSTMSNWSFSGYAAPMRPKGIPYYRARRSARSPWASRLR
jgi:hypothetical protein